MNKKIGVTGAAGYIGSELTKLPGYFALESNILEPDVLKMEIESKKPDLIVHLAAITDVDFCEKPENLKLVSSTNTNAVYDLGYICETLGIGMVLLSSFQVFSGKKMFGVSYSEKDLPAPANFYGMSKLAAEAYQAVYAGMKIVRAPYVFDYGRLSARIEVLSNHNVPYPTYLKRSFMHRDHFVQSLDHYVQSFDKMPPILNISSSETISWYQFMANVSAALCTEYDAIPKREEEGTFTCRPHKGGLNPELSYRLGFEVYSYTDGLELILKGI